MAILNGASARRAYPEDTWETVKPRIIHYYIDQGCTLERTMELLRREGFNATEKMYKTRIKRWGLKKYIKDEDASKIIEDDMQAQIQDGGMHRSHTIGGRSVTAEDARRHLKRKKMKTWTDGYQPQTDSLTPTTVYNDTELITSPTEEQPYSNSLFPDGQWMKNEDITPASTSEDTEMEDVEELVLAPTGDFQVSPDLLLTPGLQFATQSFLFGMRDFCDMTLHSMPYEHMETLAYRRFNKLWDLFCTKATHQQQNRQMQALIVTRQAQSTFTDMLAKGDPWLLISLCLLLNDNMSNPARAASSNSFLKDMAKWADSALYGHPIAQLIQFLSQTNDRGLLLLEATVRMLTERLRQSIGPHHGVSLELARLHSRIMTEIGMHHSAEKLLSHDLAEIEERFGSSSLQNLLRLSSLARCQFVAKDYHGSLALYNVILNDPLVNETWLADIKYGAMYFIAKSNAELRNFDTAFAQTREALQFSIETKGQDHYWAIHAKELMAELEAQQRLETKFRFEVIE